MGALAQNGYFKQVGGRIDGTGLGAQRAAFPHIIYMDAENLVHLGRSQTALLHQKGCAVAAALFRRLEDQLYRTLQPGYQFLEYGGGTQLDGGMDIMAAGVHHAGILGGKGQLGALLQNGQRIHVSPQGDHGAFFATLDQTDHRGVILPALIGDAQTIQFGANHISGAEFVITQFGMGMNVTPYSDGMLCILFYQCQKFRFFHGCALLYSDWWSNRRIWSAISRRGV